MTNIKSAADIAAEMVASMAVADPELDTSIGTVSRKIFDVVAEQVAPAYAISDLQDWIYSIETKSGASLDDFCAQFGIYRIAAKRAIGLIEFSRTSIAKQNIPVPANTFVVTGTTPRVSFVTYASGWVLKGTKSVVVPVQAVNAGASGNLPVGSITLVASSVSGVSATVRQTDPTTGGVDAESDEALRARFRRTVFRSLAGTEDMYLGVALEDSTPDDDSDKQAIHAVVIGPNSRWSEQIQIDGTGSASATLLGQAKMVYPGSAVLGTDIRSGAILTEGIHYEFDLTTNPTQPKIVSIESNLEENTIYDLEYEYVSTASRNDPASGVTNRIDVWVSGVYPEQAAETTYWQPQVFSGTVGDPWFALKFKRLDDAVGAGYATQGNSFLQLAWGPIVEFPDTLVIEGVTFERNTDFWVVHEDNAFGWGPKSKFGLEFAAAKTPSPNAQIVLSGGTSYYFNRLPRDVEQRAARWKLVTTDLQAHAAERVLLRLNLAIMYSTSYERGQVQAALDNALSTFIEGLGFQSVVQISDIIQTAHNVPGVDNVRFLRQGEEAVEDEANSWGIEIVRFDGASIGNFASYPNGAGSGRAADCSLLDNQVPVLYDVRYVTKAQNRWGVG